MVSEEKRRNSSGKEISALQLNFQNYNSSYGHCIEIKRLGNISSLQVVVAFEMHKGSSNSKSDTVLKLIGKYTRQE